MRCLACNAALSNFEATRKYQESNQFIDLCNHCFYSGVSDQINFYEREDLQENEDMISPEELL